MDTEPWVGIGADAGAFVLACALTAKREREEKKKRNRHDGELWWRLPVAMAGPRREDDTLVRAYPFAAGGGSG